MEWLLPAILAIVGIGTSIYQNQQNREMQNKVNAQNRDLMREQNAFNESIFERQNEYNSYPNQVRMMEQAGLNPAFMFSNGGASASAGNASAASLPQLGMTPFNGSGINDSLYRAASLKNETLKVESEANKTIAETEGMKIANSFANDKWDAEISSIRKNTELSEAERNKAIQDAETAKAKYLEVMTNIGNLQYQQQLLQEQIKNQPHLRAKLESEVNRINTLLPAELKESASRAGLNAANTKVALDTLNKIDAEVQNLLKQGQVIDQQRIHQIIENALDSSNADVQIQSNSWKLDNPTRTFIYENCDGLIGSAIKAVGSVLEGNINMFSPDKRNKYVDSSTFPYHPRGASWANPSM